MPRSFSIKMHSETQVSGRLGMSGGRYPRNARNPFIGRAKENALKNPSYPITPTLISAILEYRVMNGLMFWPRLPWIRQNSFIIYHIRISSITSLSTLMTFCKVNGTSMSPANCSRYNQSLSDLLHQWNAEEMTLSYAGPELAMPISQTAIY